MTIIEALENARECLEVKGYKGGALHDDLATAISRLREKHPAVCREEIPEQEY